MNKEEILNRSKKEHQHGDERELMIEKNASEIALKAVSFIASIVGIISLFNHYTFGDSSMFFFIVSIAWSCQHGAKYYYKREGKYLGNAIVFGIFAILLLLRTTGVVVINIFG